MTVRTKPPYRADVVGSILRTAPLKEARAKREKGEISAAQLTEVENREITRRVLELTDADESLVRRVDDRPGHDRRYSLDTSRLEALGWQKRWTLAEGLPATVAWYRDNRSWWEKIKQSDDYRAYYRKQYAARLVSGPSGIPS